MKLGECCFVGFQRFRFLKTVPNYQDRRNGSQFQDEEFGKHEGSCNTKKQSRVESRGQAQEEDWGPVRWSVVSLSLYELVGYIKATAIPTSREGVYNDKDYRITRRSIRTC